MIKQTIIKETNEKKNTHQQLLNTPSAPRVEGELTLDIRNVLHLFRLRIVSTAASHLVLRIPVNIWSRCYTCAEIISTH